MAKKRYVTSIYNNEFRVYGFLKCKRSDAEESLEILKEHTAAKASELIDPDSCETYVVKIPGKKAMAAVLESIRVAAPEVADRIEKNTDDFCLVVWAERRVTATVLSETAH